MHYRYATRKFVTRLDLASHAAAAGTIASGIVDKKWMLYLAAAVVWLTIQAFVFMMNAYLGPTPD